MDNFVLYGHEYIYKFQEALFSVRSLLMLIGKQQKERNLQAKKVSF